MPALSLTTALAPYGHVQALTDGTLVSDRVVFEHLKVSPITSAFRRMVRGLEFDIAEMALSTYLCARAYHKPMTALPIFLLRRFEHGSIVSHVTSDVQSPRDLHGRRVGVRSYTLTPGVWVRGILQHAYGVDLSQVQWVIVGDEHVQEYVAPAQAVPAPAGSDLLGLLQHGTIDAAIGLRPGEAPEIRPFIPEPRAAGIAYWQQTGIYPISHLVVVKDAVLQAHPWLAAELYNLFVAAKEHYLTRVRSAVAPSPEEHALQELQPIFGPDPLPYGVAPNRQTLAAFIQFNVEQHIVPRPVAVDELFPRSVLELV